MQKRSLCYLINQLYLNTDSFFLDLISTDPNFKPLITKNRVSKSPEKPKFQRERTFEDWLVEKMKREASIKKTARVQKKCEADRDGK